MPGKVLNNIYFLKGNNADNSNLILYGLEKTKGNNYWGIDCPFSLYKLYKIRKLHKHFPSLILSPKSHISVLSASRPFRKYKHVVHNTLPGIDFTILYNGDNLHAM